MKSCYSPNMHVLVTSSKFDGEVELKYEDGFLMKYENRARMNEEMLRWFTSYFPISHTALEAVVNHSKTLRVKEVPVDISFASFWERYDKKINKKRCEPLYEKMSESERVACMVGLKAYDYFLMRTNRKKLDPENFLKYKSWQNDWKNIKD